MCVGAGRGQEVSRCDGVMFDAMCAVFVFSLPEFSAGRAASGDGGKFTLPSR